MYPYPMPPSYTNGVVQPVKPVVGGDNGSALMAELTRTLLYFRVPMTVLQRIKDRAGNASAVEAMTVELKTYNDGLYAKPVVPINPHTGKPLSRQALHKRRMAQNGKDGTKGLEDDDHCRQGEASAQGGGDLEDGGEEVGHGAPEAGGQDALDNA
jgi:hypothetical protein